MVITGLRLVMGSWKIMAILSPRMARISSSLFSRRSLAFKKYFSRFDHSRRGGNEGMMPRAVVVFPAPVSPTNPRVSPVEPEIHGYSTACHRAVVGFVV
jgi:hypothetical protein